MVNEFLNVFLDDLPCIPPVRKIDFGIDLILDSYLISIHLYKLALTELKEVKDLMKDLLDKGFIHSSVSPWVAPKLFVRK